MILRIWALATISRIWTLAIGATTVPSDSARLPASEVFEADAVAAKVCVPGVNWVFFVHMWLTKHTQVPEC